MNIDRKYNIVIQGILGGAENYCLSLKLINANSCYIYTNSLGLNFCKSISCNQMINNYISIADDLCRNDQLQIEIKRKCLPVKTAVNDSVKLGEFNYSNNTDETIRFKLNNYNNYELLSAPRIHGTCTTTLLPGNNFNEYKAAFESVAKKCKAQIDHDDSRSKNSVENSKYSFVLNLENYKLE